MPVPKGKVSKRRKSKKNANKGIKVVSVAVCQTCGAPVLPHQVCPQCGHYKGVKVIRTKMDRMQERHQEKQAIQSKIEATKTAAEPVEAKAENVVESTEKKATVKKVSKKDV